MSARVLLLCALLTSASPVYAADPAGVAPDPRAELMRNMLHNETATSLKLLTAKQLASDSLLPLDMALQIASAALHHCREMGHTTTVTVADSGGNEKVLLRDDGAIPRTYYLNEKKIRLVVLSGLMSSQRLQLDDERLREAGTNGMSAKDMRDLPGAVPIKIAGRMIGAVAVSGSPSGATDELCAGAGLAEIRGFDPF